MEVKRVFICSPYRATSDDPSVQAQEVQKNLHNARSACRMAQCRGYSPMAPHLYFPQFLNDGDPEERETGIEMGLRWLDGCDELWVVGDRISSGMASEIARASEAGIPIKCVPAFSRGDEKLLAAVKGQLIEQE